MNIKIPLICGWLCWAAFLVQSGQGFISLGILGGILGGGFLGKFLGRRSSSRGRSGIKEMDINEDEFVRNEIEDGFRQLEETDPAHCFRRYVCDLATDQLAEKNPDHLAILNLVSRSFNNKSATYEYGIAASIGKKFRSIDLCEDLYDCSLSGKALDQVLV